MMKMIINPGSEIPVGEVDIAIQNAVKWLNATNQNGVHDIVLDCKPCGYDGKGRWDFRFTHRITGVVKELTIHGLTDEEVKKLQFFPRVYWDGSSTADPKNEDFLKEGYALRIMPNGYEEIKP